MDTLFSDYELKNSIKNKLDSSDSRVHDWYRFVLSYPPHLVRKYFAEFGLSSEDIVLDPFCGTGTTLVEAKLQNIKSIGFEANPFAKFATDVKTDWLVDFEKLREVAEQIKKSTIDALESQGISDFPSPDNLKKKSLLTFSSEQEKIILKDSISPVPLHKCLTLIEKINEYKTTPYYKYLALALAKAAVFQFSNLRFGPEVGVGKPKLDNAVVLLWHNQISKICKDLEFVKPSLKETFSKIYLNDARGLPLQLPNQKISAVITSPPYPNEKDYTRTTRLESVLLGFANSNEDLRTIKKTLLRSNTRGIYKGDSDDTYVQSFPEIQRIAAEIENRRIELGKTSGFEKLYHKVTKLYFGGMVKHLIDLQSILKPNAYLAYVVGDQASYLRVMIRTGQLLAEIAQTLGYELVRIDLFRTRFSTATKTDLNEEVVILRWPGSIH